MNRYLNTSQIISHLKQRGIDIYNLTPEQQRKLSTISVQSPTVASQTQYHGDGQNYINLIDALQSGNAGKINFTDLEKMLDSRFGRLSNETSKPKLGEENNPITLPEVVVQPQAEVNWADINNNLLPQKTQPYDPQKWFYEGIEWMKNNPYRAGLEIASYIPGVDVVADGLMAIDDYNNGDKIGAGVGAASILLPAFLDKPLKYIKKGYDWAKDAYWVTKKYDIINSNLNKRRINNYKKALSNPSFVRQSFEKYPKLDEYDIDIMKDKVPKMDYLVNKYNLSNDVHDDGRSLAWDLELIDNDDYGLNQLEAEFRYADRVKKIYQKQLEQVYEKFPILGDIAKESPQYLRQIHKDMVNNNIINQEDYIKGLIDQSNTFVRAVREPLGDGILDIKGGLQYVPERSMDFGNPAVLKSANYGRYVASFTPKNRTLTGPPETWWAQRFPKFDDPNISIELDGMHNLSSTMLGMKRSTPRRYLNSIVNHPYGRFMAHNVFNSSAKNSTIADQFNVQWTALPRDTRYTLGYNQGGKLNKRFK